ncbi:MAG: IS1 family transposase [Polyangiaceae bacterium]
MPGKRTEKSCRAIVEEVQARTAGRTDLLLTSDEHGPYETAIREVYGERAPDPETDSRRPDEPRLPLPESLCYATVRKTRKKGRVVRVVRALVFGTAAMLAALLARSLVSSTINTSFVERHNGTDRLQNARKARKTYCFSKQTDVHDAVSFFVALSYNFCWPVRTLRERTATVVAPRTPAVAAGLTDHVWSLPEWLTFPARPAPGP